MSAISGMRDPRPDDPAGLDVLLLGDGHADELAARLFQPLDLRERRLGVERVGRRHRLDQDRVLAADELSAHVHFPRLVPRRPPCHRPLSTS